MVPHAPGEVGVGVEDLMGEVVERGVEATLPCLLGECTGVVDLERHDCNSLKAARGLMCG